MHSPFFQTHTARSLLAQARSQRFKLEHAVEDVDNQMALIRQRAAAWDQANASQTLAQADFQRVDALLKTNAVSKQDYDEKRAALDVAQSQVKQALENVHQARVALGLPPDPPAGGKLTDIPDISTRSFRPCAGLWPT